LDVYFKLDEITGTGMYPGTYSFENEADLTYGTDIDFIDWYAADPNTYARIENNYNGHDKVLLLRDDNGASVQDVTIAHYFDDPVSYGTVEFWFSTTNVNKFTYIILWDSAFVDTITLLKSDAGYIQAYDAGDTLWHNLVAATNGQWYHMRIDFRVNTTDPYMGLDPNSYDVYIDEELEADNFSVATVENIGTFYSRTKGTHSGYGSYFDAFGFSWDPNYNIGDNKFHGVSEYSNSKFPLYEMATPLMGLIDNSTNTLLGLSTLDWDASINRYHSKFTLMEEIGNYSLKFMVIPTDVDTQVNSTQYLDVELLPQVVSKISLKNNREVIFNEDYSFALDTIFETEYGSELELTGYILDDSTYIREREIIPYKATDPIGEYTLTEYEIDLHGLVGDSEFIDTDSFRVEFIDRDNYNNITTLIEVIDDTIIYQDYRVEDAWISYYAYHMVDHPNKFMLIINWTSNNDDLIPFDTDLLLTYKVMQGDKITPVTFEEAEDTAIQVD
ncbi:hypothetical protein LCGC14_2496720, partial [marine sediment metagenome]